MRRLWLVVWFLGLGAWAQVAPSPDPAERSAQGEAFRRELTLRLVAQLQDPAFRDLLGSRLLPEVRRLALAPLVSEYGARWPTPDRLGFCAQMARLDQACQERKGLQPTSQGLLGLEVIWPKGSPRILDWGTTLLGVGPRGPKRDARTLDAYDLQGRLHTLDAQVQPAVLVLMPGDDRGAVKRAGLALVNAGLRRARLAPPPAPQGPAQPILCAKLTFIRLADDQEPWWKGAAEVYAFAAGIDPIADQASIRLLDLPYLGSDGTDYRPNQLVLFWNEYRFNAADFQLWEHDDDLNYQDILAAVLSAVSTTMAVAGAPVFAWIPALAEAIIRAMPSAWFRDNDDYLDTFYTLEKGRTYDHLSGAANNAVISLEPYLLVPQSAVP
jgi:hypothetical protein